MQQTFPYGSNKQTNNQINKLTNKYIHFYFNQIVISDNESPRFEVCPATKTVSTEPGQATAVFTLGDIKAIDNSNQEPNITCVPSFGSVLPMGQTNVQCQAADKSDNLAECNFVLDVVGQ